MQRTRESKAPSSTSTFANGELRADSEVEPFLQEEKADRSPNLLSATRTKCNAASHVSPSAHSFLKPESSEASDLPNMEGTIEMRFGDSWRPEPTAEFYSLQYKFKPQSTSRVGKGSLQMDETSVRCCASQQTASCLQQPNIAGVSNIVIIATQN